jgi:hypothetical protein
MTAERRHSASPEEIRDIILAELKRQADDPDLPTARGVSIYFGTRAAWMDGWFDLDKLGVAVAEALKQ